MAKVIVERPRWGSRLPSRKKGYRKSVQAIDVADLPRSEPMLGRWKGLQRSLNEHLAPMRRFLRSNVGRPWNKVHQELCEHVSFNNAVQKHVLKHIFDYVERHVEIVEGRVYSRNGWRRWPLPSGWLYVCPRTGLLKLVPPFRPEQPPNRIEAEPLRQFHFREGQWWEIRLGKLPANPDDLWDVWLERKVVTLTAVKLIAAYGGKFFAISKKPLSRSEARKVSRQRCVG
jgi:hypothetical protein